jgi:amidase
MKDELWRKSAHELAALIRARTVSSREVVSSHLERIDAVNPRVNAVTVTLAESALAAADRADASEPMGPLHGVPFTIKENIDCLGSATTNGLQVFADAMPAADAPVVARMKAAGAIALARTNLPELGLRITTDNPLRGRTLNPWDMTRTAGGSSGGEAVSLATGMSPIGLGNDVGGSLRNPAYCCGITSLKPTTGRIPMVTSIPMAAQPNAFRLMCVEGAMARSVADLQIAYGVLAGWHPQDPYSVPAPLEGPAVERKAALVTDMPDSPLPAATIAAIHQAGAHLQAAGWQVEEVVAPELGAVNDIWSRVLGADISNMLPLLEPIMSEASVAMLRQFLAELDTSPMSGTEVYCERDRLAVLWSAFLQQYPLVIGPTWADLPFLHDADLDPHSGVETFRRRLQFITPGNLLGLPAVALPMGVADGLPTGVQLYAERWREDVCLAAASVIEERVGQVTPIDPVFQ